MKTKPAKPKHIPQRTCVGCRLVLAKRSLIRIVRQADGIFVDPGGKMNGRGAYLHDAKSCWEKGLKGALSGALRVPLSPQDRQRLLEFMNTLPEDPAEPDSEAGQP